MKAESGECDIGLRVSGSGIENQNRERKCAENYNK